MAQLKEDEWPKDGEPTTAEEEGAAFKREGPNPPGKDAGTTAKDPNRADHESLMHRPDPTHRGD